LLQGVQELGLSLVEATDAAGVRGGWNGIVIDSRSGERRGSTHSGDNGHAMAE
jgi:hypothetical protein